MLSLLLKFINDNGIIFFTYDQKTDNWYKNNMFMWKI